MLVGSQEYRDKYRDDTYVLVQPNGVVHSSKVGNKRAMLDNVRYAVGVY